MRKAAGASSVAAAASSNAPLEREDVALEPGQEVKPGAEPGIRQLRQVGVEVDHARHQHERPEIDLGWRVPDDGRPQVRRADPGDPPAGIDIHDSIPVERRGTGVGRGQDSAAQGKRRPVGQRRVVDGARDRAHGRRS